MQVIGESVGASVTASLYLASSGYIVCGHQDGSIVIMVALQAVISQLLESASGWKSNCFTVMRFESICV
jgi:hypothetical protein